MLNCSIAQLLNCSIAQLLIRSFVPPYDLTSLQTALQSYGFQIGLEALDLHNIHPAVFPVLVILKPSVREPESDSAEKEELANLAIVLKSDKERVLWIKPGVEQPEAISYPEFSAQVTGQVLLASKRNDANQTAAELEAQANPHSPAAKSEAVQRPFGFKWFIPELLKHKAVWREILLASLAIQIVALATPLGTQVIIDKVVVHHTTSTLIVVAVALGIFMVFNAIMSWVRQYLVLHTGNRIDAVLAHKVFGHLLHLPMRYFEHRPTGTLVARLHGVETIREFLAGSLITLLLDFPFLIVFLAIMFWYSWQLTLISLAVTPLLRKRLNEQFLLGARNWASPNFTDTELSSNSALQRLPGSNH